MTAFKLITPPVIEPVTLDEARTHARVDTTVDDALLTGLITGARIWAEQYTARAFIAQTWQMWIDAWPLAAQAWWDGVREGPINGLDSASYMTLPRPPLMSVTSVTYYDDSDTGTVWDASNYFVDTIREPGRIALRSGTVWPAPMRLTNGIGIEYIAGYGDDAEDVPEAIKTAIRQLVSHWYENRGEKSLTSSRSAAVHASVPLVIESLLDPYRIRRTVV